MAIIYDETKMREHLIACFEQRKITTFPLYEKRIIEKVVVNAKKHLYHGTSPDVQLG